MKSEDLYRLVKSMTKSEKRQFKIHASRTGTKDKLYIKLFDFIEIQPLELLIEDDYIPLLRKKNPSIKIAQLPNLRNKLSRELLNSLRDVSNYVEIEARECFDFAKILYSKGQYTASLQYLKKAKVLATRIHKSPLVYLALDFERQIESQHVTGSMSHRADSIVKESSEILADLNLTNALSNLSVLLYGRYLQFGFSKDRQEFQRLQYFFDKHLPEYVESELNFMQRLYLYQSYVWYYYVGQNFAFTYRYARKWMHLFDEFASMKQVETASYLKSIHNVLSALFVANKRKLFDESYLKLVSLGEFVELDFNVNEEALFSLFYYIHSINRVFLFADYENGLSLVQELEGILELNHYDWDKTRIIVFQYKIACIYFGNNDFEKAILWLNKIINDQHDGLKQDIQCYARILSLITHYEMGNDLLISYQIISTYRFLIKMKDLGRVHREILVFLRHTSKVNRRDLLMPFEALKAKLLAISEDKFERRSFLFLDLISWLDSKLYSRSMVESIRINQKAVK